MTARGCLSLEMEKKQTDSKSHPVSCSNPVSCATIRYKKTPKPQRPVSMTISKGSEPCDVEESAPCEAPPTPKTVPETREATCQTYFEDFDENLLRRRDMTRDLVTSTELIRKPLLDKRQVVILHITLFIQ